MEGCLRGGVSRRIDMSGTLGGFALQWGECILGSFLYSDRSGILTTRPKSRGISPEQKADLQTPTPNTGVNSNLKASCLGY